MDEEDDLPEGEDFDVDDEDKSLSGENKNNLCPSIGLELLLSHWLIGDPRKFSIQNTCLINFWFNFGECGAFFLPFFAAIVDRGVYETYGVPEVADYELPFMLGEIIGYISGVIFVSILGRKVALILSNLSYLLITSVSISSSVGDELLYLPIVIGILFRFTTIAFIFYVAEISDVTLRACFFGSYFTTHYFGQYLLEYHTESKPLIIQAAAILAFISSLLSLFIPETPYFLASRGDLERAEDIFTWIRAGHTGIDEFDLMLDKVQKRSEIRIREMISSSTFIVCMIMCMFLNICNFNGVELYQNALEYYFVEHVANKTVGAMLAYIPSGVYNTHWWYGITYIIIGSTIFMCISFVIPRKVIYGLGFLFTLLIVISMVRLDLGDHKMEDIFPYCFIISYGGREPLTLLLPVEILPATIRNEGLLFFFIFGRIIQVYLFFTAEDTFARYSKKNFYRLRRSGMPWIFTSYYVSLIGIPFLLIFMPETKGKSLFEIEEVGLSLRKTSTSQNPEEIIAE